MKKIILSALLFSTTAPSLINASAHDNTIGASHTVSHFFDMVQHTNLVIPQSATEQRALKQQAEQAGREFSHSIYNFKPLLAGVATFGATSIVQFMYNKHAHPLKVAIAALVVAGISGQATFWKVEKNFINNTHAQIAHKAELNDQLQTLLTKIRNCDASVLTTSLNSIDLNDFIHRMRTTFSTYSKPLDMCRGKINDLIALLDEANSTFNTILQKHDSLSPDITNTLNTMLENIHATQLLLSNLLKSLDELPTYQAQNKPLRAE